MNTNYLARGLEVVAALLGAFGGFLLNIAPPDDTGVKFAVGVTSVLMLLIFLFISVFTQGNAKPANRKYWLVIAGVSALLFAGSAFYYWRSFDRLTFLYPPDDTDQVRYVNGTELTKKGEDQMRASPNMSRAELLDKFGENQRQAVWTQQSIDKANIVLVISYVAMVLTVTLALLCLIEGILQRRT